MSDTGSQPRRVRRNPRPCDGCSRRSVRCQKSSEDPAKCQNCVDYGESCTFNRPIKKRGAKPKIHRERKSTGLSDAHSSSSAHAAVVDAVAGTAAATAFIGGYANAAQTTPQVKLDPAVRDPSSFAEWRPTLVLTHAAVMDLVEVYFQVVYPVFPLFHRPTLLRRVAREDHLKDRPLYASVMAMCALASARARDGALYAPNWDVSSFQSPPAEVMFTAAEDALPRSVAMTQNLEYMRACVLLAITCIQFGRLSQSQHYLGYYHSFVSVGRLHEEANWPPNLTVVETEERRRLFWSAYSLDVFTSVIFGGIARSREASSNVSYPTELDDERISEEGFNNTAINGDSWLRGWNFITDIYRILEHAVDYLRRMRTPIVRTPSIQELFIMPSQTAVLDVIMGMYSGLPPQFKTVRPITCNLSEDLFSFQAANIAATVQLARMVHLTTGQFNLEQKCQVASEVISGFASVPVAYLRAISSPLLHHLAGIGSILGAAFEDGMSEMSYRRIRSVLLDLANLLANLEVDLYAPSGTSDKLRGQVSRIDDYMNTQRQIPPLTPGQHSFENSAMQLHDAHAVALTQEGIHTQESFQFHFPPELFEDWSWAFEFTGPATS